MAGKILVTGGTGTVGTHLLDALSKRGADFRALVRSEDKAAMLKDKGIETTLGSFEDPASLQKACDGIHTMFLLSAPAPNQAELQNNAVDAAMNSDVKHIVKLSAIGTAPDSTVALARAHAETEDKIRTSGLGWTFLHPHAFMQGQFAHIPTIQAQTTIYSPLGDSALAMIDARDIAEVAAITLTREGHAGQTYTLTGPAAVTMDDVAAEIGNAIGKQINHVTVPLEAAHQAMLDAGLPEWLVDDLTELNKIWSGGHGAHVLPTVSEITGREAMPFRKFAADHARVFQG